MHWSLVAALCALLSWAAVSDVISRRIPNLTVLLLIALFGLWVLAGAPAGLVPGLLAATIALALGFVLYLFRVMGAGDVKLFAATALFMGLGHLLLFAVATAVAGGVMAILTLLARPRRALVMFTLRGRGDYGRGIPYGVAIAIGGALTVWALEEGLNLTDIIHQWV